MKKVYLVICCMTAGNQNYEYISNVYLNKKLALISCEYQNLKFGYAKEGKTKGYRVEEYYICKLDWTSELVKLRMERNPL